MSATASGKTAAIDGRRFTVELAPGAGETLAITMKRYAYSPSLGLPWP